MFNRSESLHHYNSDTFAPNEISHSSASHSKFGLIREDKSVECNLVEKNPVSDTSSNFVNANLFRGLCNKTGDSYFNVVSEEPNAVVHDLSNCLNDIHLGATAEVTEGSDKENETNSLSLADLFYKEKKEPKNGIIRSDPFGQNSLGNLLADCSFTDKVPLAHCGSSKGNVSTDFASCTKPTLSDLFKNLLSTKDREAQSNEQNLLGESEPIDFLVDLSLTKKDTLSVSRETRGYRSQALKPETRKRKAFKAKPSLFCKVLCSKPKPLNGDSIPKLPRNLPELLSELDYFKYFSFDTPSPDDIIKRKQRAAFKKR